MAKSLCRKPLGPIEGNGKKNIYIYRYYRWIYIYIYAVESKLGPKIAFF